MTLSPTVDSSLNPIAGSARLAPLPMPQSKSRRLINKIAQIANAIFRFLTYPFRALYNLCGGKRIFTTRESQRLRTEHINLPPRPELKDRNITPPTAIIPEESPAQNKTVIVCPIYDDELEGLREFARDFSVLIGNGLYDKNLKQRLESLQESAPSLTTIKSAAKLLVEVGDKAGKPIFQQCSAQKRQVIGPYLKKIFEMLLKEDQQSLTDRLNAELRVRVNAFESSDHIDPDDYINPILKWIPKSGVAQQPLENYYRPGRGLKPELIGELRTTALEFWNKEIENDRVNLFKEMQSKINEEIRNPKTPPEQEFDKHYVQPTLKWLLRTDHSTPLTQTFELLGQHSEDLIDLVFEKAITILLEKKIDQYAKLMKKTMEERLGSIVQETIRNNAILLTNFVSSRFSALTATMDFPKTFDAILHDVIAPHVEACINIEKNMAFEKELLDKARKSAQINPRNSQEEITKSRAEQHLASVQRYPSDQVFFEHVYLEELNNQPLLLDQRMKQYVEQKLALPGQANDNSPSLQAMQKAIFTGIAEDMIALMLPVEKRISENGEIIEVDAFQQMWERLYFPPELLQLVKHAEELGSEFITPETAALFSKVKQPVLDIFQSMFRTAAQDLIKKQLIKVIQTGFEKVTLQAQLHELVAESVLPAINSQLISIFVAQQVGGHQSDTAPLFHSLLTQDASQRGTNTRALQGLLVNLAKANFKHFTGQKFYANESYNNGSSQLTYRDFSPEDWEKISFNVVSKFEKKLKSQLKSDDMEVDTTTLSLEDVNKALGQLFKTDKKENDRVFGDLTMDLIFKLGGWSGEGLIGWFIKDNLSEELTANTREMRASHHFLIENIAEALKDNFLNEERVQQLLSDLPPKQPALTARKLAHQMETTSQIAHDMLMHFTGQQGWTVKFATRKIVTDKPKAIEDLVTGIYQKLFNHNEFNQNMILRMYNVVYASMAEASEALRNRENMMIHQKLAAIQAQTEAQVIIA